MNQRLLGLAALTGCGPGSFDVLPDTGDDGIGDGGDGDGEVGDGDGEASDEQTSEETTDEGETDGGPFELLSGTFEDPGTIVLAFSNPLGPFASVDPASFRISLGYSFLFPDYYYGNIGATYYWDPNYIGYEYSYGTNDFRVKSLGIGPQSHQLRLAFENPLEPSVCGILTNVDPPPPAEIGLYVHHAPGDVPLRDNLGVELAPIGPQWVLNPLDYVYSPYEPGFPNLDPKVSIPCPF